jgi:hypothetical protein
MKSSIKRLFGVLLVLAAFAAVTASVASASTPIWGYCVLRAQVPQEVAHQTAYAQGSIDGCHSPTALLSITVYLQRWGNGAWNNVASSSKTVSNATSVSASVTGLASGKERTLSIGKADSNVVFYASDPVTY